MFVKKKSHDSKRRFAKQSKFTRILNTFSHKISYFRDLESKQIVMKPKFNFFYIKFESSTNKS